MKQAVFMAMTMMMMGVSGVSVASAAEDCASCNSLKNTALCCRNKSGCETYMSEEAGINYCRASRAQPAAAPKVSRAQCSKNYNICIRGVRSRASSTKSIEVNGKKLSRSAVAASLRSERATCQSRLRTCQRMAQ